MMELARRLYRKLLAVDSVNQLAWKSTYAGKWLQWCRVHDCGREFAHPRELHEFLISLPDLGGAINYLEFGVHQGESIRWWVEQNGDPESRFHGFDSFEGLPEDWRSDFRKGHFSTDGKTPDIADERCSFQVGWFHETPAIVSAKIRLY